MKYLLMYDTLQLYFIKDIAKLIFDYTYYLEHLEFNEELKNKYSIILECPRSIIHELERANNIHYPFLCKQNRKYINIDKNEIIRLFNPKVKKY